MELYYDAMLTAFTGNSIDTAEDKNVKLTSKHPVTASHKNTVDTDEDKM